MTSLIQNKETKQRLLKTALNLIWQNSYESVGIIRICDEAGVTKGAFYHYFKSKSDLAYSAFEEHYQSLRTGLDRVFSPQNSPLERIELYCELIISRQKEKYAQTGLVVGCPFSSSGQSTQEIKLKNLSADTLERITKYFTSLVADAQQQGLIDKDVDPVAIGRYMYSFVLGILAMGRVKNDLKCIERDLKPGLLRILGVEA